MQAHATGNQGLLWSLTNIKRAIKRHSYKTWIYSLLQGWYNFIELLLLKKTFPVSSDSAAERRRLAIQESKFLGGDMEHTHLVKGLDFALLQKVIRWFYFYNSGTKYPALLYD